MSFTAVQLLYKKTITLNIIIISRSPSVKGCTANNLRRSVRYWSGSSALALSDMPSGI